MNLSPAVELIELSYPAEMSLQGRAHGDKRKVAKMKPRNTAKMYKAEIPSMRMTLCAVTKKRLCNMAKAICKLNCLSPTEDVIYIDSKRFMS